MIRRAGVVVVLASATTAAAESRAIAYIDEVVVVGGPDITQAQRFMAASVQRAGMEPRFADAHSAPCGDDGGCLAERARMFGAAVAVRVTIAEVGGRVVVSMLASDPHGTTRREILPSSDLADGDARLAVAIRDLGPVAPRARRRVGRWVLVGTAGALAIGGGMATWYAHELRSKFYAEHVADNGDVFGISPADARAEERNARQWSTTGAAALGSAAVAGAAATILFLRDASGESRPAGVTVAWKLP